MALTAKERAREIARWIASRRPTTYLIAGWIVFFLGSYPGYMSSDAILQLFTVRSGDFTDYAPVMTGLWSLVEWIIAGPFLMLALQSGLFLFGLAAILRSVLTPRAAAITAAGVLLFPPVFSIMAVIWPDPLVTGSLLAATGAALVDSRRWKIAAAVLVVIACSLRPELVFAIVPLILIAVPDGPWWRRAGIAIVIAIGIAGTARVTNHVLTVVDTHSWQHELQLMDTVGTLRRAKIKDEQQLRAAFEGLPLADPATMRERMIASSGAQKWQPLVFGEKRIFDRLDSDDEVGAMSAAWRNTLSSHPGAYLHHRLAMFRALLGISGNWKPVFDELGNPDLLAPLHHRATSSDWQSAMKWIVRMVAKTPLVMPWLYVLLAIAVIVLLRRQKLFRNLAISGLVYEVSLFFLATLPEYRFSHWLVTTTCLGMAAFFVMKSPRWARS